MILADTSIWVDHFRYGIEALRVRIAAREIAVHPFVVAELALGSLPKRTSTLVFLGSLPSVRVAQLNEVRQMIEARSLYNRGIGLTDAHLVASAILDRPTLLWTKDKRLRAVAEYLGIDASIA